MGKKKIGILTFHDADNLGAVLQSFALESVLNDECGVSAEVIDYKCKTITETKRVKKCKGIKDYIKFIPMYLYYLIKRRGFDKFRKKKLIMTSERYNNKNIKKCEDDYDIFITGSDQVWNPECSGTDKVYILGFVSDSAKKYSYAASIGNYGFSQNDTEWINLIKQYNKISVREQSTACELTKTGVENVLIHPDPVALLTQEQWKSVMKKRIYAKKYVLVYLVLPDVNVMEQARKYAQEHGCKIISNKSSLEFILHNSPADFLSWIYNAECVFTNSFHGTIFSLIFKKQLFSDIEMTNGQLNNRVLDLLKATNSVICSDKMLYNSQEINGTEEIFKEMRNSGLKYLKEISAD